MTVFAIGDRRSNADLVVDLVKLGYITGSVLDVTYGEGRWWSKYRPENFVGCDLNPKKSPIGYSVDFTSLPFSDCQFDTVVFDPPYKLNGTSYDFGSDDSYGVKGSYQSVAERHQLICDGIDECLRVASLFVIVKCQDQVNANRVRWQTRIFADRGESGGVFRLVDCLHVVGSRPQPAGRRQVHSRRDYSSALVFKRV